jgi:hypothetical protein
MTSFLKRLLNSRKLIIPICFTILLFQEGCSTKSEEDIKELKKSFDNTLSDACKIIQNGKLSSNQKINQINIMQVRIDSLSKIWDSKIESSITNLSEKEINDIENENRLMSEKLIRTILKEMPEYKDLLRENLFNK